MNRARTRSANVICCSSACCCDARSALVSEAAIADGRTLEGLGIAPQGVEAIVPGYLYRYRKAGQFTRPTHA